MTLRFYALRRNGVFHQSGEGAFPERNAPYSPEQPTELLR